MVDAKEITRANRRGNVRRRSRRFPQSLPQVLLRLARVHPLHETNWHSTARNTLIESLSFPFNFSFHILCLQFVLFRFNFFLLFHFSFLFRFRHFCVFLHNLASFEFSSFFNCFLVFPHFALQFRIFLAFSESLGRKGATSCRSHFLWSNITQIHLYFPASLPSSSSEEMSWHW